MTQLQNPFLFHSLNSPAQNSFARRQPHHILSPPSTPPKHLIRGETVQQTVPSPPLPSTTSLESSPFRVISIPSSSPQRPGQRLHSAPNSPPPAVTFTIERVDSYTQIPLTIPSHGYRGGNKNPLPIKAPLSRHVWPSTTLGTAHFDPPPPGLGCPRPLYWPAMSRERLRRSIRVRRGGVLA